MNVLRAFVLGALLVSCAASAPSTSTGTLTPRASPSSSASGVPSTLQTRYAAAQAATTLFHVRFDQRSYSRMYAMTDGSFQRTITEAAFAADMGALRDRVGASRNEDELDADATEDGSDALVTIVMETEFDNAVLNETFVWRVTPTEMTLLVSYEAQ
jgi:hypothetical protein